MRKQGCLLPKRDLHALQDNRAHAERLFQTLHKRLCHDKEYAEMYTTNMLHNIEQGHVERVEPEEHTTTTYYLPRHAEERRNATLQSGEFSLTPPLTRKISIP